MKMETAAVLNNPTLDVIVEEADDAFWEVIGKHFPSAKSGDLSPDLVISLENMQKKAVLHWITYNVPKEITIQNPELDGIRELLTF